jgi:hypothetical protein
VGALVKSRGYLVFRLHLEYIWLIVKAVKRRRLQIELGPSEELALSRIRALGESEAEVGRRMLEMTARLSDAVQKGFIVTIVPPEEQGRFPDALPELTAAVAPERSYTHLVRVRRPWGRQLCLKGRRISVGELVGRMKANAWDAARAARELDLPRDAVLEALDYAQRNAELLREEIDEENRRCEYNAIASAPNREFCLDVLRREQASLESSGVLHAALFGSVARGRGRVDSDIDILVDLNPNAHLDLFDFAGLRERFAEIFGRGVDLVSKGALQAGKDDAILHEAVYAF